MADKEYKEMQVSGLLGWLHAIVMFLSLPFRKFWQTIIVLLIIVAALVAFALYKGIAYYNIWPWYKEMLSLNRLVYLKNQAVDKLSDKVYDVGAAVGISSDAVNRSEHKKYAVWNIKDFNQSKAKQDNKEIPPQAGQLVMIKDEANANIKKSSAATKENTSKAVVTEYHPLIEKTKSGAAQVAADTNLEPETKRDLSAYYTVVDDKDLEYVKEPKVYRGTATVAGSNSLYVADMFVYLYGIYSEPLLHDLIQAQEYLIELTKDKEVECYVIAYGIQNQMATALCFTDEGLINRALVDRYLASNIALK